ncbi:N/A [soil metagenome]
MLHIHRHLRGLKAFHPVVIAQKIEGDWDWEYLKVVPRSMWRFVARFEEKRTGRPWQITEGEVQRVLAVIKRERCQLLHVFFGNVAVHLLPLLRVCPVPVVVSFHGSDVAGSMASAAYGDALQELFRLASAVPCRSDQLASSVKKLGCPPEKLRIMRTVLPEIPFVQRQAPEDGNWRIVQAARLVGKKGLSTALRAFAKFSNEHPAASFTIAGEGHMESELKELALELKLGDRVNFSGFLRQNALQEVFESSHIFLHPSETVQGDVEGVPNAMLEAMAGGLPVVTTRHGGIPEVIKDGENGLLCEERDVAGISAALLRLAADATLYTEMSAKASASVNEQFSGPRQVAAIEAIYRETMLAPLA